MRDSDYGLTASGATSPNSDYVGLYDAVKHMEETTEKTFELSITHKGRSLFWVLYLTDNLSDNWGVCVMLGPWTLIDFSRKTKWWKKQ